MRLIYWMLLLGPACTERVDGAESGEPGGAVLPSNDTGESGADDTGGGEETGADEGDACGLGAGMCQHGWLGRLALSEAGASHGACWLQRPLQELALWRSCPAGGAPKRSLVSEKSEVAGSTSML